MLVLSRKAGEKICIGDGIAVVVNRISGGRVTLAIEAPTTVRILRGELAPFNPAAGKPEMEVTSTNGATTNGTTTNGTTTNGTTTNGTTTNGTTTNGTTLSNSTTLTGSQVTPGPRSTSTLSPVLARRSMLPPGPLRQALNNPQAPR